MDLAYLLATLELLDVVNLWGGEAVVDLNPLHGDILQGTEVSERYCCRGERVKQTWRPP